MTLVVQGLFWVSLVWLVYAYAGYPLCLWLIGRWRSFHPIRDPDYLPRVSVMISARNEEKDIGWKVTETLGWDYPGGYLEVLVASDASEDRTDEVLQGFHDSRLKFVRLSSRVGKNQALNQIFRLATGNLLFFTDANSHIGVDCLRKITSYFADPRVGCVTGMEKTVQDGKTQAVSIGSRNFLEYESCIAHLESRLGSVLVCDGSIFCIRRELFVPLESNLANDLELPMRIANRGYAVLCEPSVRSFERATQSPREEFLRRRRICAQGALGFWRLRRFIRALRLGQFLSHKVLRWLIPIPLATLLISSALLSTRPFFLACLLMQLAVYALAFIGLIEASRGERMHALLSLPFYFLLVHLAAIVGVLEAILGKRFAVWDVAVHSRGRGSQPAGAERI